MDHNVLIALHAAGVSHYDLFRIRSRMSGGVDVSRVRTPEFFLHCGLDSKKSTLYAREISEGCWDRAIKRLQQVRGRVVAYGEEDYPMGISLLKRPPFLLYLRWELSPCAAVSVVGSRKPTEYGETVTRRFVRSFISNGWKVVSGGAYGIDSIAHREALDSKGGTLAIVGTGIDVDYPAKHRSLFERMAETPGCGILSPFPPWAGALAHHFPIRNALVAAYSNGTLVTEAAENSWSLITARLALEFNKEVFAVPWDVGKPLSMGTNALIRDGLAKCVTAPEDVFSELPGFLRAKNEKETGPNAVTDSEARKDPILRKLSELGSANIDSMALQTGKGVSEITAALARFEIEWRVRSDAMGTYRLV